MKKISILIALILVLAFTVSANAVSVNKIVSKPVLVGELKVLSYLVFTKNKHFSMHDLRELLRNYRGDPSIIFLIRQMGSMKGGNRGCIYYQYLLKNNKIVKQKTGPICKVYFDDYFSTSEHDGHFSILKHYIHRTSIYHEKALANFVKRLLTLNNIYDNINSQGQHYETALYTAIAKREYRTALVLLTDKNINPNITCLTKSKIRRKWYTSINQEWIHSPTALQMLKHNKYLLDRKEEGFSIYSTKYIKELRKILEKDKNK